MNAQQILDKIAPSESAMLYSLFNPVTFTDGTKGTYSGYIVKRTKTQVRFTWMNHKQLVVTAKGVLGQWSVQLGKTWYHYVLDPFGKGVKYSEEVEAGNLILNKYRKS